MGNWGIIKLGNGGKLDGRGYGGKIHDSHGPECCGKSLCIKDDPSIPGIVQYKKRAPGAAQKHDPNQPKFSTKDAFKCAKEHDKNDHCHCKGGWIFYGSMKSITEKNGYAARKTPAETMRCRNSVFTDPLYGTVKSCWCLGGHKITAGECAKKN